MRTLLIGAGGVGGYLGARLARVHRDVTIVARGAHAQALRERGLFIDGESGTQHAELTCVLSDLESASQQARFDLILLAVKWADLEAVCDALPNLLAPNGVVVPLLNGLTSEDVVMRYVGAQRTIAAVVYMSAGLREPGRIYVNGDVRVGLSPYRPGQDAEVERIAASFRQADVAVVVQEDYRAMLWQKMVWNAPFNGLCALSERSAGDCVAHMEPLVRRAMREVLAVASAEGVQLPDTVIDAMIETTRRDFPLTEPSMLQDTRKRRPTEVEILQSEVVRRGARLGVDTPVLSTLAAVLSARPNQQP